MRWQWEVSIYGKHGNPLIVTVHATEASKDIEVSAAKSRDDVGRVDVRDLRLSKRP